LATEQQRLRWGKSQQNRSAEKTMRAVILILVVIILAIVAAIATGFLNINQIRGAKAPEITATRNGVTAKGGQSPAFDVQTGSVKVGTKETTVKVPALEVQKAGQNQPAAATNNAQ
jgi:flagellar basal body-associated protein FliL